MATPGDMPPPKRKAMPNNSKGNPRGRKRLVTYSRKPSIRSQKKGMGKAAATAEDDDDTDADGSDEEREHGEAKDNGKGKAKAKAKAKGSDEGDDEAESEGDDEAESEGDGDVEGDGEGNVDGGWKQKQNQNQNQGRIVAGLDFGSAFSAMVVTTARGERIPIGNYPGVPFSLAGRAEDVFEIPSIISIQKGPVPIWHFGWQAMQIKTSFRYANLKALLTGEGDHAKATVARLDKMNRGSQTSISPDALIREYLQHLRKHLIDQCALLAQEVPTKLIATHPVCWTPESIIRYTRLLRAAGWGDVETVNEAEAAADVVLGSMPDHFFLSGGTAIGVVDLGGMTHDRVFYSVRKIHGVIIKEEILEPVGGFGGMALLDMVFRDTYDGRYDEEFLDKLCSSFYAAKMSYDPLASDGHLILPEVSTKVIPAVAMQRYFDITLQPIIDTTKELRPKLKECGIQKVFLVGGTSMSTWLRPLLREAFGEEIELIFPSQTMSTMIATGAILAWSADHITKSRFSSLHLGHLVTQSCGRRAKLADGGVWGSPKRDPHGKLVIEVVELIKKKGEAIQDEESAEWRWLELADSSFRNFEATLSNTYVQVFASDLDDIAILSSKNMFEVAPEQQFPLTIEQRHLFNKIDIAKLKTTVWPRASKPPLPLSYAIRFVNDGLGLQLQAVWSPTLSRVDDKRLAELKVKDLGRVRFIVGKDEDEMGGNEVEENQTE
ncbi:hypothetical protein WAI453_013584 [Rhynchosporium graminicola]